MKRDDGDVDAEPSPTIGSDRPIVVKLGGSVAKSGELRGWLTALESCTGRVIVVPGGGIFADQVRDAQTRFGFDDATAHRMAILAMEQYGSMLCALSAQLVGARSVAEISGVLARGAIAVWLPAAMTRNAPAIPASWDVTSDSLAAWLAGRLDAERLVLVKSVDPQRLAASLRGLADARIVDRAFSDFAIGQFEIELLGNGQYARLQALLNASL